jgi:serine/threonine-protein kinase
LAHGGRLRYWFDMSSEESTVVVPPTAADGSEPDTKPRAEAPVLAGRYRLGRRIGKGGMGEVIAARDEQVGRDVAIKRMRAAAPGERAVRRFLREASIQGRLEHPAIVPVHELGRDEDGLPFFVMKKLSGTTLGKILPDADARARFGLQPLLRAFTEVCLAIELAHVRGIVHRDLKPENILLGDFGEVYILDWGVAKIIGEDDDGEFADLHSDSGAHATRAGTAIGTPGYMSPEQAIGRTDIDGRADIYALGCVLFEILTGEALHPQVGDTTQRTTAERDPRPSQHAQGRGLPPELDELCAAATATERDQRLATARELGDRVQRFLDGDRDLARRRDLARDHLARAQTAFGGDDEELRRTAMREAAAALALDPTLEGAASLVGRLMLDPPRTTPREVDDAIAADEIRTVRADARAGVWGLLACMAFTPLLWWIAPPGSRYVAAFTVVLVVSGVLYLIAYHGVKPRPGLVVLGNMVVIATLARMFSPLFIAPGVASVLSMAIVLTPRLSISGSAPVVGALYITAAIGPLVLERLGLLAKTMFVDASGLLLRAQGVGPDEGPAVLVGALYAIGLIIGATAMASAMRTRTRIAHRHLHLQAWQLRQLVPR